MSAPAQHLNGKAAREVPIPLGMAGLLLLAVGASLAMNAFFHPRPVAWSQDWAVTLAAEVQEKALASPFSKVGIEDVEAIVAGQTHFIFDARKPEDFFAGHIPGANNLPLTDFNDVFVQYHPVLRPEDPILVYCSGASCSDSISLCERLFEAGLTNLVYFLEGFDGWQAAGGEVVR
jgi:rhodanese-related sulfurtransferase